MMIASRQCSPRCGHCPQIENPQAFIDAVNAFLPR
jgi:pimeloyl-ACP methyl ester carboxylesterase